MLNNFINENLKIAYQVQKGFGHDFEVIADIQNNSLDAITLERWMRKYSLFRGLKKEVCLDIAQSIVDKSETIKKKLRLNSNQVSSEIFEYVLDCMYQSYPRKWVSAASKVLWCFEPNNIVIYDSYVEKVITVIQPIIPELNKFERIGNCPSYSKANGNKNIADYYCHYSDLVINLYKIYESYLYEVMKDQNVDYPYRLRLFDKLLWILGNRNSVN